MPTGTGQGASFSYDSLYLAVAHDTSPFVTIYKHSGDVFTKLTNPAILPAYTSRGVSFSHDSTYLVVSHNVSPYITIYKRSGDTFTKLDDSTDLPTGYGFGVSFSHNDTFLVIASYGSPFIIIYEQLIPFAGLNGVSKTVGWDGIDNPDDFNFMLNATTKVLSLGTGTPTPAEDDELIISYGAIGITIILRRDDPDSITAIAAIEGGDGIFEFCIVDNNIDNIAWANAAAKADLLRNANPIIQGTFVTNRNDIKSGQIITLNSTKRNINQTFLVQKVELIRVDAWIEYPIIPYKPAAEAVIGYKPAVTAEKEYRVVLGSEFIYYIFNVTIATNLKKLEDLFLYLLNKVDESLK